jgi:hypothetical protein
MMKLCRPKAVDESMDQYRARLLGFLYKSLASVCAGDDLENELLACSEALVHFEELSLASVGSAAPPAPLASAPLASAPLASAPLASAPLASVAQPSQPPVSKQAEEEKAYLEQRIKELEAIRIREAACRQSLLKAAAEVRKLTWPMVDWKAPAETYSMKNKSWKPAIIGSIHFQEGLIDADQIHLPASTRYPGRASVTAAQWCWLSAIELYRRGLYDKKNIVAAAGQLRGVFKGGVLDGREWDCWLHVVEAGYVAGNIRYGDIQDQVEQVVKFQMKTGRRASEWKVPRRAQFPLSVLYKPMVLESVTRIREDCHVGDPCIICQAEFKRNETVVTLPCFHRMHWSCGKEMFAHNDNCPVCLADLPELYEIHDRKRLR